MQKLTFFFALSILMGILSPKGAQAESFALHAPGKLGPQISDFLQVATSKLPERLKKILNEPVNVVFEKLDNHNSIEVPCAKASITNDLETPPSPTNLAKLDHDFITGKPSRPLTVHLHSAFLSAIKSGPSESIEFPCGHKNLYQTALASLLHEIGHAFDWSDALLSRRDQYDLDACEREKQDHGGVPKTKRCWNLVNLRGRISGKLNYIQLAGFTSEKERSKNFNPKRSADPYEYKDSLEHFAVNLEYFLLDPTYACRKPALYQFMKNVFQATPFPEANCSPIQYTYTSSGGLRATMDPNRVYAVHYLFADAGPQLMSKWGHSMFRLIVCAPERKEVSEECLKDSAYHVVLSYRAYVDGPTVSGWAGLTGKYPSQMLVSALGEIVEEYAGREFRNLSSLPIKLTESQKNMFVRRALEQFWTYSGKYFFLSNNCAQESDQLIKSVLPDTHPLFEYEILTPKGLFDSLQFTGLIDPDVLENQKAAEAKGFFYSSRKKRVEEAFESIQQFTSNFPYKSLAEFMETSTAEKRKALILNLEDRKGLASYYLLEHAIRRNLEAKIQAEAATWIMKFEENENANPGAPTELLQSMRALTKINLSLQPWNIVKKGQGYGIPIEGELEENDTIAARYATFRSTLDTIKDKLFALFPELNQELAASNEISKLLVSKRGL